MTDLTKFPMGILRMMQTKHRREIEKIDKIDRRQLSSFSISIVEKNPATNSNTFSPALQTTVILIDQSSPPTLFAAVDQFLDDYKAANEQHEKQLLIAIETLISKL